MTVNARSVLATGSNVFIGGSTATSFAPGVFGFNVIQAAAPTGVSGEIQLASPPLNPLSSLPTLAARPLDTSLRDRPCKLAVRSSLALAGRGGMAPSYKDFRFDPPASVGSHDTFEVSRLAATPWPCSLA